MKNASMLLTTYYTFSQMGNLFIDQIPQEEEKACQNPHIVSVHHLHQLGCSICTESVAGKNTTLVKLTLPF